MSFAPGAVVALRGVRDFGRHGRTAGFTVAGRVVADGPGLSVVATTPGSELRVRAGRGAGPNGRLVLAEAWDGTYERRSWQGDTVVRVHRAAEPWSVRRWHDGTSWRRGWYGNLEAPWSRTAIGFDTDDRTLDVVCEGEPGAPDWSVGFKDEDELAFLVAAGAIPDATARRIREDGEALAARARAIGAPFDADWDAWLPDPAWGPVDLPAGWRQVAPAPPA